MLRTQKGCKNVSFCTLVGLIEVDVTLAERMAGTTRLELATSAVTVIHSLDSTESIGYVGNSRQPSGLLGMVGRILCNGLCNARSKMQSPPLPGRPAMSIAFESSEVQIAEAARTSAPHVR